MNSMWKLLPLSVVQAVFLCSGQVMLKLALAKMGEFSPTGGCQAAASHLL